MSGSKSTLSLKTRWSCLRPGWKELVVHPLCIAKNRLVAHVGDVWVFLQGGDSSRLRFAHSKHFFLTCKLQWLEQLKSSDVLLPFSEIHRFHMFYFYRIISLVLWEGSMVKWTKQCPGNSAVSHMFNLYVWVRHEETDFTLFVKLRAFYSR